MTSRNGGVNDSSVFPLLVIAFISLFNWPGPRQPFDSALTEESEEKRWKCSLVKNKITRFPGKFFHIHIYIHIDSCIS